MNNMPRGFRNKDGSKLGFQRSHRHSENTKEKMSLTRLKLYENDIEHKLGFQKGCHTNLGKKSPFKNLTFEERYGIEKASKIKNLISVNTKIIMQRPETKEKMKKPKSLEARKNISLAQKKRFKNPKEKEKISVATKIAMSNSEIRQKLRLSRLNKPMPLETKKKISLTSAKRWQDLEYKEKTIKAMLKALFKRPTKLEQRNIDFMNRYNLPISYCGDGSLIIGGKNPDAYENNGKKLCFEFANKNEKSVKRRGRIYQSWQEYEKQRIEHFIKFGWKCLIVWEDELQNEELLLEKIQNFIRD